MDYLIIILLIINTAITIISLFKKNSIDNTKLIEDTIKNEMSQNREENSKQQKLTRDEIRDSIKSYGDSMDNRLIKLSGIQNDNFNDFSEKLKLLTEGNINKIDELKEAIQKNLDQIRKDNTEQIEKMRLTVDEKLTDTLDKRLTEKFKMVGDQLERVSKGLGEMQNLATGVGDLKKVLTNVKVRGTWGEIQLGNLLEQILNPSQYDKNVNIKSNSQERVEYAIKIPSKGDDNKFIWLPIDAKFPMEDYQRLVQAQEEIDKEKIETLSKALEDRIKSEAKDINLKYIDPPNTTDFAILYLPIEGLYAEITRRIEFCELLQRQFRVVLMGPNTVGAFLNSLQLGFRSLAIEKRSSEVWKLLAIIKNEFNLFGDMLEKTKKKLQEATNTIDSASSKSRNIEGKLKNVETIPVSNGAKPLLTDSIDIN